MRKLKTLISVLAIIFLFAGIVFAGNPLSYPKFHGFDDDGNPLGGGKLYTYAAGTTTPQVAYTDEALTVPASNPIILDSRGEAIFYLNGDYKLNLTNSSDVQITGWPIDDVSNVVTGSGGGGGGWTESTNWGTTAGTQLRESDGSITMEGSVDPKFKYNGTTEVLNMWMYTGSGIKWGPTAGNYVQQNYSNGGAAFDPKTAYNNNFSLGFNRPFDEIVMESNTIALLGGFDLTSGVGADRSYGSLDLGPNDAVFAYQKDGVAGGSITLEGDGATAEIETYGLIYPKNNDAVWDIGKTDDRYRDIYAEEVITDIVSAHSGNGLSLLDDDGNGIKIADGGAVETVGTGSIGGTTVYGFMYYAAATPSLIWTIATQNVFTPIPSGIVLGTENGITFQNGKEFLVDTTGVYEIIWHLYVDKAGGVDANCEFSLSVDGSSVASTLVHKEVLQSASVYESVVVSGVAIISLTAAEVVSLGVKNRTNAEDIMISSFHFTIKKLAS